LVKTDRKPPDDVFADLSGTTETSAIVPPPRRSGSLKDLQGILKTLEPSPNDDDCRSILEDELVKKHLK
jgi:hypothetical protein